MELPITKEQTDLFRNILLHHFPWLEDEEFEASGADVVDELIELYDKLDVLTKSAEHSPEEQ